ncbi:hypothetical protein MFIFM68171_01693 [Madurella fahalii]|uniref:Uncharacterized protein n=1 Tax=Madurella fahalii TaxID=1157608 RepID=A0ABQ0G144_9PEZI
MHHALVPILLGVFSLVWADNTPPKPGADRRDAMSLEMVAPPPELRDVHVTAQLERRQRGPDFVGYLPHSGYWYTQTCPPGKRFGVDSDPGSPWAACCDIGATTCNFPTACRGNDVLHNSGTANCGTDHCDTITLLNSRGVAATGIHSMIGCFTGENFYDMPRTWYRNTFALTTSLPTPTTIRIRTTILATETVTQRVTVISTSNAASSYLGITQGQSISL